MSQLSRILRYTQDNGLMFMCPGCGIAHCIHHGEGDGPRWSWNHDVEKPTFHPSILVRYPYWVPPATPENMNVGPQTKIDVVCHSYVIDGQIQFLSESTRELAGKTVPLPDLNKG